MTLRQCERVFKAVSDKQRLRIIGLLRDGPLVVNDIRTILHLSMSTVSQHLSILRDAEILEDSKQGRWVFYSLSKELHNKDLLIGSIFEQLQEMFNTDETIVYDQQALKKLGDNRYTPPVKAE